MFITTRVVFDIETLAVLEREGFEYSGPLDLCHHGKTGQQKVAEGQTTVDTTNEAKDTGVAQSTFGQFAGPVDQSPFYKALLTNGIESTSNAYRNARSNMTAKANMSGFGYASPIAQGADNQVDAAEAESLAKVPRDAMIQAAPLSLKAGEDSSQLSQSEGDRAVGWNKQAYTMNKGRAGLWDQLFGTGKEAMQGAALAASA